MNHWGTERGFTVAIYIKVLSYRTKKTEIKGIKQLETFFGSDVNRTTKPVVVHNR